MRGKVADTTSAWDKKDFKSGLLPWQPSCVRSLWPGVKNVLDGLLPHRQFTADLVTSQLRHCHRPPATADTRENTSCLLRICT